MACDSKPKHLRNRRQCRGRVLWLIAWLGGMLPGSLPAQVRLSFALEGVDQVSNPTTANLTNAIIANATAGIMEWTRYLQTTASGTIEVVVRFTTPAGGRGGGRSLGSGFVRTEGGRRVFEQGVASELRTGVDPNGTEYDVEFTFEPEYLRDEIWFDPAPGTRTTPVPADRTDAVTFFAHEFGHALAFNGWKETATGQLPGDFESTYDGLARFDGTDWFFEGETARRLFGGTLPLSRVNNTYHHYGNPLGSGAPGAVGSLTNGLMNGTYFLEGSRYRIGLLDLAISKDVGVELSPEFDFRGPRISIGAGPDGTWEVSWMGKPPESYLLEFAERIIGPWSLVMRTNLVAGSPREIRVVDAGSRSGSQGYYRVGVVPESLSEK